MASSVLFTFASSAWVGVGTVVIFRSPKEWTNQVAFLTLFFMALCLTSYVIIRRKIESGLVALLFSGWLGLRILELDTFINMLLFVGVVVVIEVYLRST